MVADIRATPRPTAVTTPAALTLATAGASLRHPNAPAAEDTVAPDASSATAPSVIDAPGLKSVSEAGVTRTVVARRRTKTFALADTGPADAVMLADPFATAVTRPVALTVATAGLLELKVIAARESDVGFANANPASPKVRAKSSKAPNSGVAFFTISTKLFAAVK
jgi:hypothetical protein